MVVRLTRNERKARTRADILASARKVFLRRGFHGATLDEIAVMAGYTKGAVYSNFESKDDLFLALLDEEFERRLSMALEAARAEDTLEGAVRSNGRLVAGLAQREPAWTPVVVEFWTHASRNPVLRDAAAFRHDRLLDAIAELLEELAERFAVEWRQPTREIARSAQAFARGMALERLLDPDAVSVERFEREFVLFVTVHLRSEPKGAPARWQLIPPPEERSSSRP